MSTFKKNDRNVSVLAAKYKIGWRYIWFDAKIGHQPYLKHQRLVGGSGGVQALRLAEGALVAERGPSEVELARPVHCPVSRQVVLPLQGTHRQIAGRHRHLFHANAPGTRRDGYHGVILWVKRKIGGIRRVMLFVCWHFGRKVGQTYHSPCAAVCTCLCRICMSSCFPCICRTHPERPWILKSDRNQLPAHKNKIKRGDFFWL